jgi:large subunit ribosomal protein L2
VIIARDEAFVHLKLPSGEVKKFPQECYATVGALGNSEFRFRIIGKAGRKIHMGIRPTVRGTAQNPRSHPHGGGEGRTGEGMHAKTPWGKPARGKRTRARYRYTSSLIIKHRK